MRKILSIFVPLDGTSPLDVADCQSSKLWETPLLRVQRTPPFATNKRRRTLIVLRRDDAADRINSAIHQQSPRNAVCLRASATRPSFNYLPLVVNLTGKKLTDRSQLNSVFTSEDMICSDFLGRKTRLLINLLRRDANVLKPDLSKLPSFMSLITFAINHLRHDRFNTVVSVL